MNYLVVFHSDGYFTAKKNLISSKFMINVVIITVNKNQISYLLPLTNMSLHGRSKEISFWVTY